MSWEPPHGCCARLDAPEPSSSAKPPRRLLPFLLGLLATFVAAIPVAAQDAFALTGRYVVVATRSSSLVPAQLDADAKAQEQAPVGTSIDFDNLTAWFDGGSCIGWEPGRAADAPFLWAEEPYLSDLQVAPGTTDSRLNLSLVVDCGARDLASIKLVMAIDARVLVVANSGQSGYFILEKPLPEDEALGLEQGLSRAGLNPGPADGVIDASTRDALAAFAETHSAAYRFESGVITQNLLDALLAPVTP